MFYNLLFSLFLFQFYHTKCDLFGETPFLTYKTQRYIPLNKWSPNPQMTHINLMENLKTQKVMHKPVTSLAAIPKVKKNRKQLNKINKKQREGTFCHRSFDGRSGYCILAHQCLHVIKEHRQYGTKIDVCSYRNNIAVICCPLAEKHLDRISLSAQKCMFYNRGARRIQLDVSRNLTGKKCVSTVPLIVGGEETRKFEYSQMVALGWSEHGNIKWECGGVLISEQFVLTAAHCTTLGEQPPDVVRLGSHQLNDTLNNHYQDIKILLIILHPKYQTNLYYHDLALLKLSKRVRISAHVRPACLWQMSELDMDSVTAIGWGKLKYLGEKTNVLRKVDLNLIKQDKCRKIYKIERRLPKGILDHQFCAGHLEGGKDTCQGDSGGPVLAELPEYNCVQFVVGLTSFGKFCASPNAPGVYTKIYPYLNWIESIVFQY